MKILEPEKISRSQPIDGITVYHKGAKLLFKQTGIPYFSPYGIDGLGNNMLRIEINDTEEIETLIHMFEICRDALREHIGTWEKESDDVPVKHGHWIYGEYDIPHCSECGGEVMPNNISLFCPNCGAKMDGGKSDE